MSKVITAAVIGCGSNQKINEKMGWSIGHSHANGWLKAEPGIALIGVDPNSENLKNFGDKFGVHPDRLCSSTDSLFEALTPDFVSVCTWPALHAPQTVEAAERGVRGIVCEKPMALNPGEVQKMIDAVQKVGCRLAIAHQRRLDPEFLTAKRLIDVGLLGEELFFEGRVSGDWDVLSWTTHWFDMANYFFGEAPQSVLAAVDHAGNRSYGHAVENGSVISATYAHGKSAVFLTGADVKSTGVTIRGTKALLKIGQELTLMDGSGTHIFKPDETLLPGYSGLMSELIDVAGSDRPMTCDITSCAAATLMAYAAHESARTMRRVAFPIDFAYAPLEAVQQAPRPLVPAGEIILLADAHFGSGGREGIVEAIHESTGRAPVVIEAEHGIDTQALANAGLLLMYHTHGEPTDATKDALTEWVLSGKPLVLIHAALGAYREWDEFRAWAGRVWKWSSPDSSYHPIAVSTLNPLSDIWPLTSSWLPEDEVWARLETTGETIDLVSAVADGEAHPAAWINRRYPNVGVWVPGHRRDIWRTPAMRAGLFSLITLVTKNTKEN